MVHEKHGLASDGGICLNLSCLSARQWRMFLCLVALLTTGCLGLGAGVHGPLGRYRPPEGRRYGRPRLSSFYLKMRDGVKIAVDLYLPSGLGEGEKIPAILVQTRYGRRLELRAPLRWLYTPKPALMPLFLRHGYAWVQIDVRGSAASFGVIPFPWSPDEISDGNEVVDWIVRQPWSNGRVGALGVSYDGVAALLLLANRNPAVRAVAPLFSFWDIYPAAPFPGGIFQSWFINHWSAIDWIVDHNAVWEMARYKWYIPYFLKGIAPVDGPAGRAELRAAVRGHNNVNIAHFLSAVTYRSDRPSETAGLLDGFDRATRDFVTQTFNQGLGSVELSNPARYKQKIEALGRPLYSFAGWYDGATARSAIEAFCDLSNPQWLVLGPWIHAVTVSVDSGQRFDLGGALLRFFDYTLKGLPNDFGRHPRVLYYTMVEGKWKCSATWPPANQELVRWYLSWHHALVKDMPGDGGGYDVYTVDPTVGTGHHSRWEPLVGNEFSGGSSVLDYGDRRGADKALLVYDSAPLESDIEVTGHPAVSLFMASSAHDGEVFAYLEDVQPDGSVRYVTEGELRLIDRKVSQDSRRFCQIVPCHSFLRQDRVPMTPGVFAEVRFDLYPISYLFRKGHALRLALAGADRDHFEVFPGRPPTWRVARTAAMPSHIVLPVVPRRADTVRTAVSH